MQGPYSQQRSKRRNISRSAGSGGRCEGEREQSRTFTCTLSWTLSLSFWSFLSFLSLSLPGGRPGPRRRSRRGKESVMRRGCSMALRDMELARLRQYREPGGTRRYREPAGGRDPPPPVAGRKRRGWAGERATGTLGHCHRRGGPGHRPPGHPPSVPGCCRPPVVPATSLTVTPAAVPVNPRALLPPSRCSLFPWHCHPCQ